MSDEPNNNRTAAAGLIILLVVLAGVAYAKVIPFRQIVDTNAPWFKEKVGHYLVHSDSPAADGTDSAPDDATPAAPGTPGGTTAASQSSLTLDSLAAQPALWPKSVFLKSAVDFVAVVNREPVGTVHVPPGTEVHLMKISNGRLGLEYKGGGAWVLPQLTDIQDRVQPQGVLKL